MSPDILIIGSGMGGATLAAALAPTGRKIVILERGDRLEDCNEARDPEAIFARGHFKPEEEWLDGDGRAFNPGVYYVAGGSTKFYGAVLIRYRAEDFVPRTHIGGVSPGWPIGYVDLAPWYQQAEALYSVRGSLGDDPTEPPHLAPYSFPAVPHEPAIDRFRRRMKAVGMHPSPLPLGVDLDRWLGRGATPWDAFPDTCGGKMDAESVGLARALAFPNVVLKTDARVRRLAVGSDARIAFLDVEIGGKPDRMVAPVVVLAAGAVNTAAILLGSADDRHPSGIANRSDQVGRNFMNHNCSAVLALHPFRRNPSVYQKTLMFNDFYNTGGPRGEPLGNIQLLGKISGPILKAQAPGLPRAVADWIAARSIDIYAMSEDLPDPQSRVTLKRGQIVLDWRRSNWAAHLALVAALKRALRRAGFPVVISRPFDRRTPSHQCGTARMGNDPARSVVDSFGRSHDHPNLFVCDAAVLPTSAAVNPALTIAALALRTGHHIAQRELAA